MNENGSTRNESPTATDSPTGTQAAIDDDRGIAIWPIVMRVWSFRRVVVWAFSAALGVFLLGLALVYLRTPVQKTAQVGFRLLFDGAEKSEYPNGMPFSPTDIVSVPILEEVYKANNLQPYDSFDNFKSSFYVNQTNIKLEVLEESFRSKLADTKLSGVDRQRVEREFDAQRNAMVSADYELVFVRKELFRQVSVQLAQKVLFDILNTYARDADQKKGALKYRVSMPTRNLVRRDLIEEEDYIVSLDMLRNAVQKIQVAVTALQAIPGSNVVRIGPNALSLTDVQGNLDDLLRFRISPMIGFVRAIGVSKNAALTIQYLENQLFTINLERDAAKRQVQVYSDSLRTYVTERPGRAIESAGSTASASGLSGMGNTPAFIPQLGDSFFDRLIELGTKGDDTAYRQDLVNKTTAIGMRLVAFEKDVAYYQDLISVFRGSSTHSNPVVQKQFLEVFQARYPKTFEELMATIDNLNLFYDTISKRNLNPASLLLEVTVPASVSTKSSLSGQRVEIVAVTYFSLVGVVVFVGILIFARFRERKL